MSRNEMNEKSENSNIGENSIYMTTTVQKWGNSLGVRIPKKIADKLEIEGGSVMAVIQKKGKIILEPIEKVPSLEELMEQITPENQHKEVDWGEPRGAEIW